MLPRHSRLLAVGTWLWPSTDPRGGRWPPPELSERDSSGSGISVKTKTGKKYHGELVSVAPSSLLIEADEPAFPGRVMRQRELCREDIREVRLLAPVASILAGGAMGAGLGAGIGAGVESTARSNEDRGLLTAILAFLGAALGVAIAHHNPSAHNVAVISIPRVASTDRGTNVR
jgi:hypothetical protein